MAASRLWLAIDELALFTAATACLDLDRPLREIDRVPLQSQQLTPPHPRVERQAPECDVYVAVSHRQEAGGLSRVPTLHLGLGPRRRCHSLGYVAGEQIPVDSLLQRLVQDGVDKARRLGAEAPISEGRVQLLDLQGAERAQCRCPRAGSTCNRKTSA